MSNSTSLPIETPSTTSTTASLSTMPPTPPLTLILAATPSLGIGKGGGLPWPQLKKEMGYFARVTKRVSAPPNPQQGLRKINAVLMGRKTWDSIPPKFRPLKDRLNIVITRKPEEFRAQLDKPNDVEGPIVASGIVDALSQLVDPAFTSTKGLEVEQIFVIGGASIYQTALELPQTKRVLLTKIQEEYECDTFFPVNLEETTFWRNASRKELAEYTGEQVQEGGIEEQGVKFEFCMYERE